MSDTKERKLKKRKQSIGTRLRSSARSGRKKKPKPKVKPRRQSVVKTTGDHIETLKNVVQEKNRKIATMQQEKEEMLIEMKALKQTLADEIIANKRASQLKQNMQRPAVHAQRESVKMQRTLMEGKKTGLDYAAPPAHAPEAYHDTY